MSDTQTLSPEDADAFRTECREFLEEHATGIARDKHDPRDELSMAACKKFQTALHAAGLAGLSHPKQFGGQGLTREHEKIWREEYANHPDMTFQFTISHGMCLPMLAEYGTDEQREKYMPTNISGEDVWCQMFSEPGAGSDVASLQSKAELDGDEWIINGQKVWTTLAHVCSWGIVIARTNPEAVKHAGISMFIIDMDNPGIEIRPIHQIDGGMHFNEVFFTDARVPKENLLGDLNNGWRMATAMLMYERVAIGTGSSSGVSHPHTDRLTRIATKNGTITDPVVRQNLMRLYSMEIAKSLVSMRTRAELKAGKTPGPGGSLGKLAGSNIMWYLRDIAHEVVGPEMGAWEAEGDLGYLWSQTMLSSFMASIAGGTDEIQKNIIGDRVLGLPREPSVDKGVAFRDLKVGTQA